MRPPHDLMERLAAADPMRDAEAPSAEEQRDADALLERLVATPVEPERRRPVRLRWAQLAAAAACASVAVFVALSVLGGAGGGQGPQMVERAAAALAREDAVYHLVGKVRLTAPDSLGGSRDLIFESWNTIGGRVHRKVWLVKNGRRSKRYEDFAGRRRPGRLGGPALRYDPLSNQILPSGFGRSAGPGGAPAVDPFDPGRGLRELESQGRLKHSGSASVGERRGYRLVSAAVPGGNGAVEHSEFVVARETYLPLSARYTRRERDGSTVGVYERFLTYERLPLNDKTRAHLDLDPHPGAKCAPFAGKMTGKRDPGIPNPCKGR
jgi:hypothetical protein